MAKLTTATISKRTVEAVAVEKDTVYWDPELSGFGVRAYPSGSKYYVVRELRHGNRSLPPAHTASGGRMSAPMLPPTRAAEAFSVSRARCA